MTKARFDHTNRETLLPEPAYLRNGRFRIVHKEREFAARRCIDDGLKRGQDRRSTNFFGF